MDSRYEERGECVRLWKNTCANWDFKRNKSNQNQMSVQLNINGEEKNITAEITFVSKNVHSSSGKGLTWDFCFRIKMCNVSVRFESKCSVQMGAQFDWYKKLICERWSYVGAVCNFARELLKKRKKNILFTNGEKLSTARGKHEQCGNWRHINFCSALDFSSIKMIRHYILLHRRVTWLLVWLILLVWLYFRTHAAAQLWLWLQLSKNHLK